jgi:hypothetical protein
VKQKYLKILQDLYNLIVSFFANLVHFVFFSIITTSTKIEKEKIPPPTRPKRRGPKYSAESVYFTSLDIALIHDSSADMKNG